MNLLKRTTASVALVALVSGLFSTGVSADYASEVAAANALAEKNVINSVSTAADYRLGATITRAEMAKVTANLAGLTPNATCEGRFADVSATTPNDWVCGYVEALLDAGMISANVNYNPNANVSKTEALRFSLNASGEVVSYGDVTWQADYVSYAVENGFVSSFADYNTAATRGFVFSAAAAASMEEEEEDDILGQLEDLLNSDDDEDMSNEDMTDDNMEDDDTTVVVSGDNVLMVELSPKTPSSATIPGGVNGLAAAAFDFTAGSEDVTVSQISVKRNGLSDAGTLDKLAVFTDEGRVSNAKSDNQENDTTAQINLDNGGVTIKAGETKTMVIVVDVNSVSGAANDEFALELVDVVTNTTVTGLGATGNTMRVGSVDAPTITFQNGGSVSNPNLGEAGADIFEFEIKGDSDEDVMVESITFEGSSDAEDDLINFELLMGNQVVATTTMMSGDYLTFETNGLVIEEDKNEDFTVRADVIDGAGDTISFGIDAKLDVTANSTKFGFGAGVVIPSTDFPGMTIQAGELTFIEVESNIDEIREDKDNVVLATFEIRNLSGNQLELEDFAVNVVMAGSATVGTTGPVTAIPSNVLEEVELYNMETGASYELPATTDTNTEKFKDTGIDAIIGEWTSTWMVRADTAEDINGFDNLSFDISVDLDSSGTDVKINETMDDERVEDITPSNLSFDSIDGSESGAKVNVMPLSNTNVVRGANDVIAFEFEVEAEEVASLVVDELSVVVRNTTAGAVATKQQISQVALYQDSINGTMLDSDTISNAGGVTFDDMGDVSIAADGRETFVVVLDVVDGTDPVNQTFVVELSAISIEDDENDDITVLGWDDTTVLTPSNAIVSGRSIAVQNSGTIATLALDTANEDNEFNKLALAGESAIIASWDVRGNNEEIDVETATFTIAGVTGTLRNSITTANLLLDGVVVGTASNSDISNTSILFDDLNSLILPETTTELALQLNTAVIGKDEIGAVQTGLTVTAVTLSDAEGDESGKDAPDVTTTATSKTMDIVSAVVTPSVVSTFGTDDQTAELRLTVDGGENTTSNGDAVQAELTVLTFDVSSLTNDGTITVFNGNGDAVSAAVTVDAAAIAAAPAGQIEVTLTAADSIGNDNETYRVENTAEAIVRLAKGGVTYTINGNNTTTTKLENTLELGQYANSN